MSRLVFVFSLGLLATACGGEPTSGAGEPVEAPSHAGGEAQSPRALEAQLFSLLGASRAERRLEALEDDPELAALSRAHGADMREAGFFGHESPTYGDPGERVERAGHKSALVLENVAQGRTAKEIHEGWLASPGHRRNMLHPEATHVGIGVEPDGQGGFFATQIFVKRIEVLDLEAARERLLSELNASRRSRGLPAVAADPNLTRAADVGAADYFADPSLSQREAVGRATSAASQFAVVFSRVSSVMTVVDDLDDVVGMLSPSIDASVRAVGIGLAQGERPDVPAGSIAVIVLLGRPR